MKNVNVPDKDKEKAAAWTFKEKAACMLAIIIVCACLLVERAGWQNSAWMAGSSNGKKAAGENAMQPGMVKKTAYLTFDDGPSCLTESYLDILKEEGAKATFFLIGQQIDGDMEEIKTFVYENGIDGIDFRQNESQAEGEESSPAMTM